MQKNTDHIFGLKQPISRKILKLHNCANPCTHILFYCNSVKGGMNFYFQALRASFHSENASECVLYDCT